MEPGSHRSVAIAQVRSLIVLVLVALGLHGCSQPEPTVVTNLEVSRDGAYVVDGNPATSASLAEALRAKKKPGHALVVNLISAAEVPAEHVLAATSAASAAGAKVGVVGNEKF